MSHAEKHTIFRCGQIKLSLCILFFIQIVPVSSEKIGKFFWGGPVISIFSAYHCTFLTAQYLGEFLLQFGLLLSQSAIVVEICFISRNVVRQSTKKVRKSFEHLKTTRVPARIAYPQMHT